MLTMKVIFPSGVEIVEEVTRVIFDPGKRDGGMTNRHVEYQEPKSAVTTHISEGTIYVMNENGKTVADYILGECVNA